ncbi:40S ribosomal protein S13-2 [Paramecium bursaria]
MGRMQSKGKGKGISGSALPYKRKAPKWLTLTSKSIVELIEKLAKKGLNTSQIGVQLRDQQSIPQTKYLTGQKILRILKKRGCAPKIPEDLYALIKKAVQIRKHLEKSRKDTASKFRLILVESRIHRLSRYYRRTQKLPASWKYVSKDASALLSQ